VWEKHKESLSEDILHRAQRENPVLEANFSDVVFNQSLILIEDKLLSNGGKRSHATWTTNTQQRHHHVLAQDVLLEISYDVRN
jgi:hypothetical protein